MKGMLIKIRNAINDGYAWIACGNTLNFLGFLVVFHGILHMSVAMAFAGVILWGIGFALEWFSKDADESSAITDPVTI